MKYRILGKTGLKVSAVGYGCWGIGGDFWNAEDERSRKALRAAVESGVTFFDTAFDYGMGHSEILVGELVKEYPNLIIATKIRPKDEHWPAIDNNIQNVFPKDYIIESAMKSYKNLGKQIDILQLHTWRDAWVNENCWQEAFDQLKEKGIIKYVGVSVNDHDPKSVLELVRSGKIDSIQIIYNIFDQSPEDELFAECIKNKVGVIARVPLDEGSLTGKFTKDTVFTGKDWRGSYFTPERLPEVVERVEKLRWLENPGRTLVQAALQFCLHHPAVSTVIPGSTNPEHVKQNALAADGELSQEEVEKLKLHKWIRNFYPSY